MSHFVLLVLILSHVLALQKLEQVTYFFALWLPIFKKRLYGHLDDACLWAFWHFLSGAVVVVDYYYFVPVYSLPLKSWQLPKNTQKQSSRRDAAIW